MKFRLRPGGVRSLEDMPVYSRGVKKGQKDLWGMTTDPGEPAKKTVYGAAVQEITVPVEKIPVFWIL